MRRYILSLTSTLALVLGGLAAGVSPAQAATFAVTADLEIRDAITDDPVAGVDLAVIAGSVSGAQAQSTAAGSAIASGTTDVDGMAHLSFSCNPVSDGPYRVMVKNVSDAGPQVDSTWVTGGTTWTAVTGSDALDCGDLYDGDSIPDYIDLVIPVLFASEVSSGDTGPGGQVQATLPAGTTIQSFDAIAAPSADSGFTYPVGVVDLTFTSGVGATVPVELVFESGLGAGQVTPRKLTNGVWGSIPGASVTATTLGGNPALKLSYSITDGGAMDEDGVANGVIQDPAGLGRGIVTMPTSPKPFPATAKVGKPAGKAKVGKKLTAAVAGFPAGTTYTYQWLANGKPIKKAATGASLKLTKAQKGKRISVTVWPWLDGYATLAMTSVTTAKVKKK